MSDNNLKYIPEEISNLTELIFLYMSNNQIDRLPYGMRQLKNLIALTISNNPLREMEGINSVIIKSFGYEFVNIQDFFIYMDGREGIETYHTHWLVPDQLRTAFQQYLNFLTDFVERVSGKVFQFNIEKIKTGLALKATVNNSQMSIDEVNNYLNQYINILCVNSEEFYDFLNQISLADKKAFEIRQLIRELRFERDIWFNRAQTYLDKIYMLNQHIIDKNLYIEKLQRVEIQYFNMSKSKKLIIAPEEHSLTPDPTHNISVKIIEQETIKSLDNAQLRQFFNSQKKRLENNMINEAISEFKALFHEKGDTKQYNILIAIAAKFQRISSEKITGTISYDTYNREMSLIINSLLQLCE